MHTLAIFRAFLTLGIGLGDILGGLSSVIGIGSGLNSLAHSGNANVYKPKGLGQADTSWQDLLGQLTGGISGAGGQITPELAQAFQSLLGIDRSAIGPAGAQAGQQYGALAGQAQGASSDLLNQGRGLGQAGQQLWNTSLDPQNEMRNYLQQQVTDASRAGTSARGIGMGGESAGIENKAVGDFLRNWNFDQLQRQQMGLSGYANAANQSGRNYAGGLTAGALSPEYTQQSAMAPFNANVTSAGFPFQASQMYTGAMSPLNQQYGAAMAQIIPYLNSGQGASQQGFYQGQVGLNNLTSGLYGLGAGGGGGGYNPFGNIFGGSSPNRGYYGGSTGYSNIPGAGMDYGQGGG